MAAQVYMPQKKGNQDLQKILTLGGIAAGAALAGPLAPAVAGAAAPTAGAILGGAATGAGLGSTAGSLLSESPMQRRMVGANNASQGSATQNIPDPISTLERAKVALANQPKEVQQQYGPTIQQALLMARRGQQGVA